MKCVLCGKETNEPREDTNGDPICEDCSDRLDAQADLQRRD